MREIIKAIIVIALVFVSFSETGAETVASNIVATFTADDSEELLVPNQEATEDHVELLSDGVWDPIYESLQLSPSQLLSVRSEALGNIYQVVLVAYLHDDTLDRTCSILSATGSEIIDMESLGSNTSKVGVLFENEIKWIFNFETGVRLSDISFQFKSETYLCQVKVYLDVTPVLPSDEIRLYGNDKVPFANRSNFVKYKYNISSDLDNIRDNMSNDDDFSGSFQIVPDEGVSLAGFPDGKYVVYVSADPYTYKEPNKLSPDLKHVIVNYMAKSPSTGLESVEDTAVREYYDLYGRKLIRPIEGLQILKDKRTGSAKIIRL